METMIIIFFFIAGTIFGSFFNVVGLRVPAGNFLANTRSHCPSCNKTLSWYELIPVISYLIQRGRCRACQVKISLIYPVMEFITGLLFALSYCLYSWDYELIFSLLFVALTVILTVADISYQKIPNIILLIFTPIFIAYRLLYPLFPWWDSLLGAGVAFVLLFLIIILSKGGMGMGDLKYLTLLGFIFGLERFLLLFLLANVFGVIIGVIKMLMQGTGRKTKLAFGPSISLAAIITFFFGAQIISFYLQLF